MGATLGKTIQRGIARGGCANETGMGAAGYGHAAAVGLCGSFRSGGRHAHRPLHFRVWRCSSPTSGRLPPTRAWPFIRPFRALSAPSVAYRFSSAWPVRAFRHDRHRVLRRKTGRAPLRRHRKQDCPLMVPLDASIFFHNAGVFLDFTPGSVVFVNRPGMHG